MLASTLRLQSDLAILSTDATRQLGGMLAGQKDPDAAKAKLIPALKPIVALYGAAALAVATDWYDSTRAAEGVGGRFRAVAAPDDGQGDGIEELVSWGLAPVYSPKPDWVMAGILLAGGLQRRILSPARDSTRLSSIRDPKSRGWRRDGVGKCDYCSSRIKSHSVYTQGTLACHDRCGCQAVPAWS